MNNEKIRLRILAALGFVLLVLLGASVFGVNWLQRRHIREDVRASLARVQNMFLGELEEEAKLMSGLIGLVGRDEKLQKAWLAKDRDTLLERSAPLFQDMRLKYGITHFFFHGLDRVCFLRVHNPSGYGDYIERFTLDQAVRDREPVHGIELGPFGTFTLRVVHPWRVSGEHVGYIELGMDAERLLADQEKEMLGVEIFFTIDKSYLNRARWQEGIKRIGKAGDWDQFSDFVVTAQTMQQMPPELSECLGQLSSRSSVEHLSSAMKMSSGDRSYEGGFLPLLDAGGRDVGDIVVIYDTTSKEAARITLLIVLMVTCATAAVALVGFFYWYAGRVERNLVGAHNDLKAEIEERKQVELSLREKEEKLTEEIRIRQRAKGKLEDQIAELADARQAALNMMEEAEKARKRAEETQAELKESNLQLEASVERANELAQEARAADLTKSQFLANISHEIRTPMNAIIGFSEVLADGELMDEQREHVSIVRASAEHLLQLINDILDFFKIEAGELDIKIADYPLEQLFVVIESLLRPAAQKKQLAFEVLQCGPLPAQIRTDPLRLNQCLVNLVSNAIKFTENGHVYVSISLQETDDKPYIRFDVEDTGIGIPPDRQDLIFEEFAQIDGSATRRFSGAGLGLAITKKLVDLLGGELSLTSEVGTGSVFSLTIPAGVDVKSQPSFDTYEPTADFSPEPNTSDAAEEVKFSAQVLVAEDSQSNQMLIKLLLEKLDLQVTIAQSGKEAVDKALSQPFDLIFMDIQMPGMDGYEATEILRRNRLKTPIIALTAYAMKGDDEKCFEAGCNDYIAKPIDRETLLRIISKYLPSKSKPLSENIDSVKRKVDELSQLCSDTASSEAETAEPANVQDTRNPVDWTEIMNIYDDEDTIKQVVKIIVEETPQTLEALAGAIRAKNSEDIQRYGHKLKGAARHLAAVQLSEKAERIECAGRNKDIDTAASLFGDIQSEFEKLTSFLSQQNWMEIAKRQNKDRQVEQ